MYWSFGPALLQFGSEMQVALILLLKGIQVLGLHLSSLGHIIMRVEHVLLEACVLFVCPTTPDMAVVGGRVL